MRVFWILRGAVAGLLVALLVTAPLSGQAYPSKPIEFVVPFGAGGGSDILARTIARILTEERIITVPIVVANKPGGSGAVGWSYVLSKRGDPYVLTTISGSFWTTPLVSQAPFKVTDFTPLAGLALDTFFLVVRAESAYRTVGDIVKVSKATPEVISVGGSAIASDDRVVTAMLEKAAGIKMTYVPFGGSGPALTAMLGGHVSSVWLNPAEAVEQIRAKKVRALAVSSTRRLTIMPDVPTFRELGYDVVWDQYRGVSMPPGVPAEAVQTMWNAFQRLCRSPKWQKEYIEANMLVPMCQGPAEWKRTVEAVAQRYVDFYREIGLIK
ncbi:MAG TPA: tripartite tricarboxylate transporter substrate binding protein [bacterium]|nr:tripartite tricarboxylate transporter substrate binding protein [bacterium]